MSQYSHEKLAARAKEIAPQIIEWRHQIHSHPELAFHETATSALIEEQLKKFGLDRVERIGSSKTGVLGVLKGTGTGPELCIGVRADIDALPIQEESGVPFAANAGRLPRLRSRHARLVTAGDGMAAQRIPRLLCRHGQVLLPARRRSSRRRRGVPQSRRDGRSAR